MLDKAHLPEQPLYGNGNDGVGWQVAPAPYTLPQGFARQLPQLGQVLWQFQWACEQLYLDSLHGKRQVPAWIAEAINQGKPLELIKFATMKRQKRHVPRVLRPDVLLTESPDGSPSDGRDFVISELDSVPGGLGFTSALNHAYRQSGFAVEEGNSSLPLAWYNAITAGVELDNPVVAIVVSDEASDYHAELTWLAEHLREAHQKQVMVVHPKNISLLRDRLVITTGDVNEQNELVIDVLYRFFELFDLPNIPNIELIQFAVKKGLVAATPPWKPHLEEKLWLALLHHPVLKPHWAALIGNEDYDWLLTHVPQGWVLDPAPLPPQAVLPDLCASDGLPFQSFHQLATATQKERELVIKPSGFSPLSWGSRGVVIGHDVNSDDWAAALEAGLGAFGTTPHILQRYHKPIKHRLEQLDLATGQVTAFDARTRLCPYFLATPKSDDYKQADLKLGGVLATHCPANKKIIHGMVDAIMAPVSALS